MGSKLVVDCAPIFKSKAECMYCANECDVSWWIMCDCWLAESIMPEKPPLCAEGACRDCDHLREPLPEFDVELGIVDIDLPF